MELFHQLAVPNSSVFDVVASIDRMGVTTKLDDKPILVRKIDGFKLLECSRDNNRAVFDIGPSPTDDTVTWLVYVNTLGYALPHDIRVYLESRGAKWDFHDG